MKTICLVVGKKHDPDIAEAIQRYQTRLAAYTDFSFDYIPSSDKDKESEAILKRFKDNDLVVLLDESGEMVNNIELADVLNKAHLTSRKRIIFVIGGAYGVNREILKRSDKVISFSRLTFPHQLMRLLVVEQLYRSFNLQAGGKYHH